MRNLLKLSLLAVLAVAGVSCSKEKTETLPSLELGEVTLSEDEKSAVVEVVPSGNAEELHWTCVEDGGLEYENGAILRDGNYSITLPNIKLDTDYKLTVYTQNSAGKSQPVVKEFNFRTEELIPELAQIQYLNSTIVTLDVRVIKSVKCSKYTVTLMKKWEEVDLDDEGNPLPEPIKKENFDEASFREQSDRTVAAYDEYAKYKAGDSSADEFKMFAVYPLESKTSDFGEYNLLQSTNLKNHPGEYAGVPIEAGEEYVVAVCAYDAEGNSEVYTQDVTIPTTSPVKGTVDMSIELLDVDKSYSKVKARFTADAGCKRIFYGISVPDEWGDEGSQDMTTMTNAEFEKCLMTLALGQAHIYNGPIEAELKDNIMPGVRRVIWAIGVDAAGNIGKVDRAFFTAPSYRPQGSETVTSVDKMENAADGKSVNVTVSVSDGAKKLRVLAAADVDWTAYSSNCNYWLYLPAEDGGGVYNEYDVVGGKVTFPVKFVTGEDRKAYYIYGAAMDADGNLGYGVNLVYRYNYEFTWPIPSEGGDTGIVFDGTGALDVKIESENISAMDQEAKYKFTVTRGAGTKAAYYAKVANVAPSQITDDNIIAALADRYYEVKDDLVKLSDFSSSDTVTYGPNLNTTFYTAYVTSYGGGDVALFISEDNDGKLRIAAMFYAGGVDQGSETGGTINGRVEIR